MKRLLYLVIAVFTYKVSAQSFTAKNVNDEYIATSLDWNDFPRQTPNYAAIDKMGLCWFHNINSVYSFDGVNWRSYSFKSKTGDIISTGLINDLETDDEGNVWIGTDNGLFIYDQATECFVTIDQKIPNVKGWPGSVSSIAKVYANNLLFSSYVDGGFYLYEKKNGNIKRIIIGNDAKADLPIDANQIAYNKTGVMWGVTPDSKGVWQYNNTSGKISCSWKNELSEFTAERFKRRMFITYSENGNALWISYRDAGIIEKMNLSSGKSNFYSFSGDLLVHSDTSVREKYKVGMVRPDKNGDVWVFVDDKYLVKLNPDIRQVEYLVGIARIPQTLPIEGTLWIQPEKKIEDNNILFWIGGYQRISYLLKRKEFFKKIKYEKGSFGIDPSEYINFNGDLNIYFQKSNNNQYYIFNQDSGRIKFFCFDKEFHLKKVLFDDEWKQYPAFFSNDFDNEAFYIAMMRPGTEPLDFRNTIIKEFRVDLKTFKKDEVSLSFGERIRRYGNADAKNVYWLLSNGYLYSYEPQKQSLDSLYICKPSEKGSFALGLLKGYGYPTFLHKNTSTYWISFIPSKEVYKIDLASKKVSKVLKCCTNRADCSIPGPVYFMHEFDSNRMSLLSAKGSMLLNLTNDSISDVTTTTPTQRRQLGIISYKNWICKIFLQQVEMLNTQTGEKRLISPNEGFIWRPSIFNSKQLINDRGELVLMSSRNYEGFMVINFDSVPSKEAPGTIHISSIVLDNKKLLRDSLNGRLFLKYNGYQSLQITFSDLSIFDQDKLKYEYTLYKGPDTAWNKIEGKTALTFSELSPGKYQLLLRAINENGICSDKVTTFSIAVSPPWWQTWWFRCLVLAGIGFIFYCIHRYRIQQLKRMHALRNNIAGDLHDDIGSTLNSISIYSEVAKQQAGKEIPALDMIGLNSRRIIESMSDIVWTINPENDSFERIIVRMRSFAHQLLKAKKVEYTFEVDEKLNSIELPMQVRKNFYLVFKETITNLIKYSGASRVEIVLKQENKNIVLRIRDNGIGIPENPEGQGNGLINMKRRAKEIEAELNIVSGDGEGTAIELMLKHK